MTDLYELIKQKYQELGRDHLIIEETRNYWNNYLLNC